MKPKIVHYIDSRAFGGAEELIYNLLEALDKSKWDLILIHHPSEDISRLVDNVKGLNIETISLPRIKGLHDIKNIGIFIKEIRRIKPQIFHAHLTWYLKCTYGIVFAYLSCFPAIIATQHLFDRIPSLKLSIYQKIVSLFVTRYIAVSQGTADMLKETIFFKNRLSVIHNGINIKRFRIKSSNQFIASLRKNSNTPIVLNVARINKNKGHIDLLKAASITPDTMFLFVGDGPEKENFENQAKELGIDDRVFFMGRRDDIPEFLAGCDIFILPSLLEGLPLTILEAMAAGKPVIASDIKGIREIITDGENGILVPTKDPISISKSIKFLMSDPSAKKEIAASGEKTVEQKFTAEIMAENVSNTYSEILGD